ncbi:DUF2283 domain-containing protein [Georgenia soli]|nr:DUF2283 domain-containing protein [Georgenia soli]
MIERDVAMATTFDAEADAAYIYLAGESPVGGVTRTVVVEDQRVAGMVNLDFDSDGRLVGVEVVGAMDVLPQSLLDVLSAAGPRK